MRRIKFFWIKTNPLRLEWLPETEYYRRLKDKRQLELGWVDENYVVIFGKKSNFVELPRKILLQILEEIPVEVAVQ